MKPITLLFFLFVISGASIRLYSQEVIPADPSVTIQNYPKEIKAINSNGKEIDIPCQNYKLPETIEITDVLLDSTNGELFFLAKKGVRESAKNPVCLISYNYQLNQMKWGHQSKYYKGIDGFLTSDHAIFRIYNGRYWKNFAFDKKTGVLAWQNNFDLEFPILSKNIAFNGSLQCIDLIGGSIKWDRKIDDDYALFGRTIIGAELLTIENGVHLFNLDNGSGWDIPFRTGKNDPSTNYDLTGLNSKVLIINDRFFFSAMDNLICADYKTGKKNWLIRLPETMTGNAFLDSQGENLVFINRGCGYNGNFIRPYFIPYLLILNKENGKILFLTTVKTSHDPINDYFVADSLIYLLTQNDIFIYNQKCLLTKKLSTSSDSMVRVQTGKFLIFINEQIQKNTYMKSVSNPKQYVSLFRLHEEGFAYFLYTEKGILCIDKNMHKINWIPEEDIYQCLYRFNNKCILSPMKKYATSRIIVEDNEKGELVYNLKLLYRSKIEDGYLLIFDAVNSVSVVPLSNFNIE